MPSKAYLLSLGSGSAVIDYAVANLDINAKLVQYKRLANGQKQATFALASNPNVRFSGIGSTNLEAIAEAISTQFPG